MKFNIEGLSSLETLHLKANTAEVEFSIKNLPSLINFDLSISGTIGDYIVTSLFEQLPYIQELHLDGNNLDNFVNLRVLELSGTLDENFNFELFQNLCNQLEDIKIFFTNIDEKSYIKLFVGYTFPYLVGFAISFLKTKRLKKEFLNGFRMLKHLNIFDCNIKEIAHDSFSNLEQLCSLYLSYNRIEFIGFNVFSKLKNLQEVDLTHNEFIDFDIAKRIGLKEIEKFENNDLFFYKKPP